MPKSALALLPLVLLSALIAHPASAQEPCPCELPDNGNGTADMPPDCVEGYQGLLNIVDGIPGGSINVHAEWGSFFNVFEGPGGILGGTQSTFDGVMVMQMTGQGTLAGFLRTIPMQVSCIVDWAPRVSGDPYQGFSATIVALSGDVLFDPDFDSIELVSGAVFTLDSPGWTSLTRLGPAGSPFQVESFFDVDYEISFVGAPGSVLDGLSGTTRDQALMRICPPRDPTGAVARVPDGLWLGANYPNPFNPSTRIDFALPDVATVNLDVFDARGRLVRRIIAGELRNAGPHSATWDGLEQSGAPAASGVYFFRLRAGNETAARRMVLLK